jgi:hypothetical protein
MRRARALPIFQLMPAVGSRKVPVATPLLGGLPGKTERPHLFSAAPHVGHPINHHVTGPRPWTQIRLGAGTPDVVSRTIFMHGRNLERTYTRVRLNELIQSDSEIDRSSLPGR